MVAERDVLVVTRAGNPIQGVLVRQSWKNYSLESSGHEEDKLTGEDGRVSFPPRTLRANFLLRAIRPIANLLGQGVHASFGVHTDIIVLGDGTVRWNEQVEPKAGDMVFRLH